MKNISLEYLKSIPVNKKINSVVTHVNDNINPSWLDKVTINIHGNVCWWLYHVSQYYDLDDIKVIFDIGSLNGIESYYLAQILPNVKVYSFEANPASANVVRDNQKLFPDRLFCIEKAVSDFNDMTNFYLSHINTGGASLLRPTGGPAGTEYTTIPVECITVDKFCEDNNINAIDLLWMDLQGNELNALKGMTKQLQNIKCINTEAGSVPYYENHTMESDITKFLEAFGFYDTKEEYQEGSEYERDVLYMKRPQ